MEDEVVEEFWKDSVLDIASEFDVPRYTAAAWERNIGGTEVLKETLGRHAPGHYLDLIRRREWIPHEREDREEKWIEPLKRWCTRRTDDAYLVHQSERQDFRRDHGDTRIQWMSLGSKWLAAALTDETPSRDGTTFGINRVEELEALEREIEEIEEWVKYEMRRVDAEWIELTRELRAVEKELIEIYQEHLDDVDSDFQYKKDEIIELKRAFPYLLVNTDLVVEVTDSSRSYVTKFKYIPNEGVASRRVKGKLRDEILERDDHRCVSCGIEEDLQVHHIIPRDSGGENSKENLATLCADCHFYAHGGGRRTDDGRVETASWDAVEYDSQSEFWDEWINRNFDDRAPKNFNRTDPEDPKME